MAFVCEGMFLGIGGQKCASTWLYNILMQHPSIRLSRRKEVDFFSYYFDKGYEWYESNFDNSDATSLYGDVSPSYLIHPNAPSRAFNYNSDFKIILILRDPIDRAYSNHLHEIKKGHISIEKYDFTEGVKNNPLYLDQGRYGKHLERWLDVFPREQILVLFQEEIEENSLVIANQVFSFLGLTAVNSISNIRSNESVLYRNKFIGSSLWRVGFLLRRRGLGSIVEFLKNTSMVRQLRHRNRIPVRSVAAPISQETESFLFQFFLDDVRFLEELLGRPVPWKRFH
ncbi:sulfotransferase domain-containing protein [Donghicola mangrovi]|uniref:Sulfotransferase domain-containing protein n=1 Tax=Donghicola mangrovi TaxID=2729614 RepID=A0A850Q9N2_9RHOB|nr:sulfotransferase domain-containing protein [Donghicola mangrovi]NVO23009.1 sulfotransferase domain-containing protein [Donghicola mangrovi]